MIRRSLPANWPVRLMLALVMLALGLSACSSTTATPQAQTGATQSAYPGAGQDASYPGLEVYNPYPEADPSAIQIYATPGPIPTPAADRAVVFGQVLLNGNAVVNTDVVLAEITKDDQGKEILATYDVSKSPRAITDGEGKFALGDVAPGRYGVVLDTVLSAVLLRTQDGDEPLVITLEAGQSLDMGTLDYTDLPIPDANVIKK